MKDREVIVVPQSFEILPEELGLEEGIEICGRICYKSEDKITKLSALGFCKTMVKYKHNSVLEMGVVTYLVESEQYPFIDDVPGFIPKFIVVDQVSQNKWLITGSVRAIREAYMLLCDNQVVRAIVNDLNKKHSCFFVDLDVNGIVPCVNVQGVTTGELEEMSPAVQARHFHVAVKFITNRAVTHEIVRHRPCAFLQESQRYCRYSENKFGNRVTFVKPTAFYSDNSPEYEIWEEQMLSAEKAYFKLLETSTPQAARTVLSNSCKTELIVYANLEQWHHIFHMRAENTAAEPSMREIMIPLSEEFTNLFPSQGFNEPRRMPEGWVKP